MRFLFRPQVLAFCSGLTALASLSNAAQLTVAWDDNSPNESGFRIERAMSGGEFSFLATVGTNVTSYTDSSAVAGKTYAYRVAAFNATAVSSFSNVVETAVPEPIVPPPAAVAPSPVTPAPVTPVPVTPPPAVASPAAPTPAPVPPAAQVISPVVPTAPSPTTPVTVVTPPSVNPSRLVNLSVRAIPAPGDSALIVGFVVNSAAKNMLVRAVGPGLSTYTNAPIFVDPKLTLYQSGHEIGENDNWSGSDVLKATFSRVGAFPLPDSSKDAVLSGNFSAKAYTASVTGTGTGLALAEIYDADAETQPQGRLVNVSARAHAGPGDGVLIVGFVISGDTPLRVLVRALGPSLKNSGVAGILEDPQLNVFRGTTLVGQNSDWGGSQELRDAFAKVGASELTTLGSKDAAVILNLPPGAYTAVVSGVGATDGIALAEVYELP